MESLRQGLSQKILGLRRPWRASSIFHFSSSFKQIVYDSYMQAMQCYDFKLVIVDHRNPFFVSEKELSHAEESLWCLSGAYVPAHSTALKNFLEKKTWQARICSLGPSESASSTSELISAGSVSDPASFTGTSEMGDQKRWTDDAICCHLLENHSSGPNQRRSINCFLAVVTRTFEFLQMSEKC